MAVETEQAEQEVFSFQAEAVQITGAVNFTGSGSVTQGGGTTMINFNNPFTVIGVAALVGAVLMLARPWRWLIRPALFVGLVPQLLTHALKRLPATSWIDLIGKFGRASQKHKSAARRPSAQPATPPL